MDLQFFIETIKSGLVFGFIQVVTIGSVKEISSRLKSIFKGQSLPEKKYDRIAEIVKEAYEKDNTEEGFIKYLENSDKLKEILESKEPIGNTYQETKGDYSPILNNVKGPVTFSYGVDPEKK